MAGEDGKCGIHVFPTIPIDLIYYRRITGESQGILEIFAMMFRRERDGLRSGCEDLAFWRFPGRISGHSSV